MTTSVLRGRLVLEDTVVEDGIIEFDGATITRVCPVSEYEGEVPEASDATYLPGLVDVHCHGGGGESFPNAETAEAALVAVLEHRRHGTTSLVASCVTASAEVLRARAKTLAELAKADELAGIHFEGPFVSHERCGAQDPTFIVDPDADLTRTLIEDCQGYALSMTLAPEKPGAYGPGSVAEALIDGGALPSWGHTDSNSVKAREALAYSRERFAQVETKRGPRATITHLFNGMRPLHHRDTGPIAEFLSDAARGGAVAELICDSIHVDPSLVRDVYELVGREHVVLITDAMAAAGMADGQYTLGPQDVIVKDGVARLAQGNAIAGGTAHLMDCVRVAVTKGGIPLVDAVYMASVQGATILGDDTIGSLAAGKKADIVEVDSDLAVRRVWRRGTVVALEANEARNDRGARRVHCRWTASPPCRVRNAAPTVAIIRCVACPVRQRNTPARPACARYPWGRRMSSHGPKKRRLVCPRGSRDAVTGTRSAGGGDCVPCDARM